MAQRVPLTSRRSGETGRSRAIKCELGELPQSLLEELVRVHFSRWSGKGREEGGGWGGCERGRQEPNMGKHHASLFPVAQGRSRCSSFATCDFLPLNVIVASVTVFC